MVIGIGILQDGALNLGHVEPNHFSGYYTSSTCIYCAHRRMTRFKTSQPTYHVLL